MGLAFVLAHCASGESGGGVSAIAGTGGSPSHGPSHTVDILGSGVAGMGSEMLNALCGSASAGTCVPDDAEACAGIGGSTGYGGAPNMAGATAAAGAAGIPVDVPTDSGDLGSHGFSCQLALDGERVTRSCQPAGTGKADAPCLSSAQCKPGLACVGEGSSGSGLCRPYCCEGVEASCDDGYYCAPRRVVGAPDQLSAPVCVPVDNCSLTEEYPCPAGVDCQCASGTACTIVRADGTTSCVTPGKGQAEDACDDAFSCAWGHVCSLTNGCLPLCSTVSTKQECGENGYCQARFPSDVGVCIDLDEQTGATK